MALLTVLVVVQATVAFVIEECFFHQNVDIVFRELANNFTLHFNVAGAIFKQDGHMSPVKFTKQLYETSGQLARLNLDVGSRKCCVMTLFEPQQRNIAHL